MARADRYFEPYGNELNPLTHKPIYGDPMTAIGAGASVVSGISGSRAAKKAAKVQANSADQATAAQKEMFNTVNGQQKPYRDAGYTGLDALMYGMGLGPDSPQSSAQTQNKALDYDTWAAQNPGTTTTQSTPDNRYVRNYGFDSFVGRNLGQQQPQTSNAPNKAGYQNYLNKFNQDNPQVRSSVGHGVPGVGYGSLVHQFNADDLKTNLSPSYKFMLDQGKGALQNSQAAQGSLVSGNGMKGIVDYAENYASTGYQQAYSNYTNNQNNIFTRLSNIAGMGQTANQTTAQTSASFAPGIASTIQGAGQARASGIVGASNNMSNGINNAFSWYQAGAQPSGGGGGGGRGGSGNASPGIVWN